MCVCVPVEQKVNKRPVGAIMSPPRHHKTELIEMSPPPHTCKYNSMFAVQKDTKTVRHNRRCDEQKPELFVGNKHKVCVKECVLWSFMRLEPDRCLCAFV